MMGPIGLGVRAAQIWRRRALAAELIAAPDRQAQLRSTQFGWPPLSRAQRLASRPSASQLPSAEPASERASARAIWRPPPRAAQAKGTRRTVIIMIFVHIFAPSGPRSARPQLARPPPKGGPSRRERRKRAARRQNELARRPSRAVSWLIYVIN